MTGLQRSPIALARKRSSAAKASSGCCDTVAVDGREGCESRVWARLPPPTRRLAASSISLAWHNSALGRCLSPRAAAILPLACRLSAWWRTAAHRGRADGCQSLRLSLAGLIELTQRQPGQRHAVQRSRLRQTVRDVLQQAAAGPKPANAASGSPLRSNA